MRIRLLSLKTYSKLVTLPILVPAFKYVISIIFAYHNQANYFPESNLSAKILLNVLSLNTSNDCHTASNSGITAKSEHKTVGVHLSYYPITCQNRLNELTTSDSVVVIGNLTLPNVLTVGHVTDTYQITVIP
jgi:hypothetical protein